ncbi:unnamed protein product [Arctogadus glacialis]
MKMVYYTQSTDLHIWECRRKRCGRLRRSVRTKSLFSNSHCSLFTWMKYIHRFAQGLQLRQDHTDICKESTRTIMIITLSLNGVDCHGCPCDICLGLTAFDVLKDGGNREQ